MNDIQDSVINLQDSVINFQNFNRDVITNTGSVSAVKGQIVNISSITLTLPSDQDATYLILFWTGVSINQDECMSADLSRMDSNSEWVILSGVRGNMYARGGISSWGVLKVYAGKSSSIVVQGYGYSSSSYKYEGKICAIRIH